MVRFVKEIIEANKLKYGDLIAPNLSEGFFRLKDSGCLEFFDEAAKNDFFDFFNNFDSYIFSEFGALRGKREL